MNMNRTKSRIFLTYLLLLMLIFILIVWNVGTGTVKLSPGEILSILSGKGEATSASIIWQIRLPRLVACIILGGALALAGFLLQTFFHNPIAGPFVLGISSGAKLIVALSMIACLSMGRSISSLGMVISAFAGAMISMGFVLVVSRKVPQMSMLIICGVMISYICSAVTDFVVTFADDSNIVNLHNWSLGSFSGMTWSQVSAMTLVILPTFILVFFLSKPLGAYQLGENYARNLGVNIRMLRLLLILSSSMLAACVTAFAGPISFVGIAVPHLIKGILKTAKPLFMIPACFLGGSCFCLLCDLIARTLFSPTELSISSVTAVFGAPVVIFIMLERRKGR